MGKRRLRVRKNVRKYLRRRWSRRRASGKKTSGKKYRGRIGRKKTSRRRSLKRKAKRKCYRQCHKTCLRSKRHIRRKTMLGNSALDYRRKSKRWTRRGRKSKRGRRAVLNDAKETPQKKT